jgi:hypothetical protein
MKNDVFRPIDFWKSAVMTMPDNSFYDLLRSVFGKIKTPFNKQQLLNDLEAFLLRKDIQKTIAAYIDETDAKIIAATALFKEPVPAELENFFCDEFSCAQMQDIIVNLEERFILYRYTEENKTRLALNPVLESVLQNVSVDFFEPTEIKDPAEPDNEIAKVNPINDLILAALYSFVFKCECFYRSEGVIRRRVIDEGKTVFPGINLEHVMGSLQVLGLFYADANLLVPDKKCFDDFSILTARERMEYCAAAMLIFNDLTPPFEILPPLFRGKIHNTVTFINSFLNMLKAGSHYSVNTLKKIIEITKTRTGTVINTGNFFDALEKTGLLVQTAPDIKQIGINAQNTKNKDMPVISIDSGFSILVYPEIDFTDAIKLASVLNIRKTCTVICFELDKNSAVRAFNNNTSADEIIELLKRLSDNKIDETLIWNLKDWEKRHGEVSLRKGVVLQLSEDHRYLMETRPLAALIKEILAPGLYLLNENAIEEAADALQKAGIDIIAQRKDKKKTSAFTTNSFLSLPPPVEQLIPGASAGSVPAHICENSSEIKSRFRSIIEKMQLNETEQTELSARIERRLVLCDAQLKDAEIRYEKLEARHMDYAGKQNIAKQAISGASPVEAVWSSKGTEEKIFGIPQTLEKSGNELILVINTTAANTDKKNTNQVRIPLAKISLLRRIKKSIFER